jgi:superfamily II DNA helicase RecQ
VVLPPEVLVDDEFAVILDSNEWKSSLKHVHFDECHVIETWASFRSDFRRLQFLRLQFPQALFYFTTATFTVSQTNHIRTLFTLPAEKTKVIRLSNERKNVQMVVLEMKYPASSYRDLLRFLYPIPSTTQRLPPTLLYVNTINEAESVATFFCSVLKEIDPTLEDKAVWVHSLSSKRHVEQVTKGLASGEYWIVVTTELLGMVNSPDLV